MKIKQTIGLLLWAAMAACTSDIAYEEKTAQQLGIDTGEDLVPVEFSVSSGYDLTRAASSIVTFTSGEAVKVCVRPDGAADYTGYDFTAATSSQNVTLNAPAAPAAKPYFPPGESTTVEAYAYYPATAGDAATYSVADDQTSDASYKASDLMYAANRTITKGSSEGTLLTMQHLMAQLALTVNVVEGSGLTIHSVTVVAKKSVTFTPADGTAIATGDAGNIIALSGAGTGYVLIPQQTISGVSIKVATGTGTEAETATYNFTAEGNFAAGNSYPITLTVAAGQLGVTSVITDWNGQQSVVVGPTGDLTISPISAVTYDGSTWTPSLTVTKDGSTLTLDDANGYTCQWFNNTNAGTAAVVVLGQGTNAGSIGLTTFTINPKPLTDEMVSDISAQTYTRSQITPSVTVTDGSALTSGTHYTLSYGENINVSTGGSVTVEGTGNYTGSVTKEFTISPKDISDMTLTLTQTSDTYTGSEITASVSSLMDGTYSLDPDTEFTVDGSSVTSATDAAASASDDVTENTITVIGTGNYTGSKDGTWSIARATPTLSISSSPNPMNLTSSSATGTITVTRSGDGAVTVTSSNTGVATTSVYGTTAIVTAIANGSATITVKMDQGTNYTAYTATDKTCSVSVSGFFRMVSSATSSDVGKVICSNGHIHNTVSAVDCGGSGVAVIAYVGSAGSVDGSSSTYKGLAIALSDVSGTKAWKSSNDGTCVSQTSNISTAVGYKNGIESTNTLTSSGHSSHGHAAASACRSYTPAAPTSYTSDWFLPSMGQWQLICQGLATKKAGSSVTTALTTSTNDTYKSSNLNSVITAAGGTGFQADYYWSSTECNVRNAWYMYFYGGSADYTNKTRTSYVRAVLAF